MIPIMMILLLAGATLYLRKRNLSVNILLDDSQHLHHEEHDGGEKMISPTIWAQAKKWWLENEVFSLLVIPLVHVSLYAVFPDWWKENFASTSNWRMWLLHLPLIMFIVMIPKGEKIAHPTIGKMGFGFVSVMMLIAFFWKPGAASSRPDWTSPTTGYASERIYKAPANPEWSKKIYTPGAAYFNPEKAGKVRFNGEDKLTYDIEPDKPLTDIHFHVESFEFQSKGEAMRVAVAK